MDIIKKRKYIGVFTPCLNEKDAIYDCYLAVKNLFNNELLEYDYEHLFSDNGSTDGTQEILRQIAVNDPNVKVILNTRNFGFGASCLNGIKNIQGDAVLLFLPADLQDPPELIPEFIKKWEQGYEVVAGIRKERDENYIIRSLRSLHYIIINKLSNIDFPTGAGEFVLVDKKVLNYLKLFDDYDPFIRGMVAYCGFKKATIPYLWKKRIKGKTKTNLYYLIHFAINGIISHTNVPMRLASLSGLGIAFVSFFLGFLSIISTVFHIGSEFLHGIPTLATGLFFFSGVQLIFLGILGEYISAIHFQVRKKPLVVESERLNFKIEHSHIC